jgi:hypothetical protein
MNWNGKKLVTTPCVHCNKRITGQQGAHYLDGDTSKPYHFACRAQVVRQRAHDKLDKLRAAAMV